MNKIKLLNIVLLIAVSFLFACNLSEKSNELENDVSKTDVVNEPVIEQSKEQVKEGVLNIIEIKKDDIIEGLLVTNIEYIPNENYSIDLKGDFEVSGNIAYNEYEELWYMVLDDESAFKTIVDIEGEQHDICKYLAFRNFDKLRSIIGADNIKKIEKGEEHNINIKVNNLVVGCHLTNGLLAFGYGDFIKCN